MTGVSRERLGLEILASLFDHRLPYKDLYEVCFASFWSRIRDWQPCKVMLELLLTLQSQTTLNSGSGERLRPGNLSRSLRLIHSYSFGGTMVDLIRHSAFSEENCEPLYIKGLRPEEDERRAIEKLELWIKDGLGVDIVDWQYYYLHLTQIDQARARSRTKPSL